MGTPIRSERLTGAGKIVATRAARFRTNLVAMRRGTERTTSRIPPAQKSIGLRRARGGRRQERTDHRIHRALKGQHHSGVAMRAAGQGPKVLMVQCWTWNWSLRRNQEIVRVVLTGRNAHPS